MRTWRSIGSMLILAVCIVIISFLVVHRSSSSREISKQIHLAYNDGITTITNGTISLTYHTASGFAEAVWKNGRKVSGIYAAYKIKDSLVKSTEYAHHTFSKDVKAVNDGFGTGAVFTVVNKSEGKPDLLQHLTLYDGSPYFFVDTELNSDKSISTGYMSPMTISDSAIDMKDGRDNRVLLVPFDNDAWSRYQAIPFDGSGTSYEAMAVYDNTKRDGFIFGSVTHDIWKTGLTFKGVEGIINELSAFGGIANSHTSDTQPHGQLNGKSIQSPTIFIGYYNDWRDGMEAFGQANATRNGTLSWSGGVPFGWNSWGTVQEKLTYDKAIFHSDYIKTNLQNNHFDNQSTAYINLDSYWDNMSDLELQQFVDHVHQNGQKAGIYWAPFVYWGDDVTRQAEGSKYSFWDLALKQSNGKMLEKLDGAYPLDPTHPGTKQRIHTFIDKFNKLGFDFIKLDFLTHGSLEGMHYDSSIQTGMQAYNEGMKVVLDRIGGKMFISASISPIFPSQYVNSRRIACDTYGVLSDVKESTEYMLENLTYGWWQNGTIYTYTDPDHMKLIKDVEEARSRVNSAAIGGTVFLDGDDLSVAESQQKAQALLTNPNINAVARLGRAFRPVEGNTGLQSADSFVLNYDGATYLAIFNFSRTEEKSMRLSFARFGLKENLDYTVTDLWTGKERIMKDTIDESLASKQSKIFKISP